MSASNKKKLRKEQADENLSTKQKQAQAEAKQLKIYTISFLVAMILIACVGLGIGASQVITSRGLIERATTAATVGDRKLNTVEFNYYYMDAVNKFYNQFTEAYSDNADTYMKLIYGLDPAVPLNKQYTDDAKTESWADYFVAMALNQAKNDFAMYDLAVKENFTLSESSKSSLESTISMLETYAAIGGFENANQYLSAVYGSGATVKSYREYYERSLLANEYYVAHEATFVYTDADRDAYQADKKATYNSYAYSSCYLTYTNFRGEGTKGEDGKVTYSAEQDNEARKKMEEYAKELAASVTNVEELKEKIKEAPVSEGVTLKVEEEHNVLHDQVSTADLRDWLSSADRKVGDVAAIKNESTTKDAEGKETKVINGYYVVIFNGVTDNTTPMANISYMFVPYEGGVEDEDGEMIYSNEEIEATKTKVEGYLKQWNDGAKTAASFEELTTKLIKEKKASAGGPIENMNPSSDFDSDILDWVLSTERAVNNTNIIEADNGFYLILYTAKSELNYRQYMIDNDMRVADYEEWYNNAVAQYPTKVGKLTRVDLGIVLSPTTAA